MPEHPDPPAKACEPDDPMALVGMVLPDVDQQGVLAMADCVIEEFLRMGHTPARVAQIFAEPFYAGPHRAWQQLGEAVVRERIAQIAAAFGPGPGPAGS